MMSVSMGVSSSTGFDFESGSFRDRTGRVFRKGDGIYRLMSSEGLKNWDALSQKDFFVRGMKEGRIVETHRIQDPASLGLSLQEPWSAVLQHQPIPFISYPYEWSFGMLKDAALLQLELLKDALREGMILKDSSPFNIQWEGVNPTFIDILSFEEWKPGEPWIGYRQFCQMFLYPLFLQAYKELSFHAWLRGSIDGISVEQCNQVMSFGDLFRKGVLVHCYLQNRLQSKYSAKKVSVASELKSAGFRQEMIQHNVNGLHRLVQSLTWYRNSPSGLITRIIQVTRRRNKKKSSSL